MTDKQNKGKEKRNLPKKKNGKILRFFIWLLIVFMALSGSLALFKVYKMDAQYSEKIEKVLKKTGTSVKENIYSVKMEKVLSDFVNVYMNYSSNQDLQQEREKALLNYFADGLKDYKNLTQAGSRVLLQQTFYDLIETKKYNIAKFEVAYKNVTQVKTSNKLNAKMKLVEQEKKMLLNVPFIEKDGAFLVVGNPYFTSVEKNVAPTFEIVSKSVGSTQVPTNEKEKVREFLMSFFEKYTTVSVEDMGYMMHAPQTLEGLRDFSELQGLEVYKQDEIYVLKTSVIYKEKEFDLYNIENYYIELSLKDGKYFVENFEHGGI